MDHVTPPQPASSSSPSSRPQFIINVLIAGMALAIGIAGTWWVMRPSQPASQLTSLTPTPTTPVSSISPSPKLTPLPAVRNQCQTNQLKAEVTPAAGGNAAGNFYYTLTLTNSSTSSCTLTGFPGISLADAKGAQIGQPAERTKDTVIATSIDAGQKATATIHVTADNFAPGVCQNGATQIRIYPPDQKDSLLVSSAITTWCPGFTVTPFTKN